VEVGQGDVESVPPTILAVERLVLTRVTIQRVVEQDVMRAGLAEKRADLLAEGDDVGAGICIQTDIVARGEGATSRPSTTFGAYRSRRWASAWTKPAYVFG
jgi:hypothetical protein